MQISAIGPNFQGKRDRIDELINMDDNSIRQIAYIKTASQSNDKKSNNVTKALFAAAPIAAGLAYGIATKGNSKIFSKNVTGFAAKIAEGLKVTGLWAASLGAVSLVSKAKSELSKASPEVRDFDNKHPLMSMTALFAAGFGAIALVNKGAAAIAARKAPKLLQKGTETVAKFLNKNKQVGAVRNGVNKFAEKIPPSLKAAGYTVLGFAPTVLLLSGVFNSIGHSARKNQAFAANYNEIKDTQIKLAQARQRELSMENDFLKQDIENKEDLELLKAPLKDLPEETVDDIAE